MKKKILFSVIIVLQALLTAQCLKAQLSAHVIISDVIGHYGIYWRYESNFTTISAVGNVILASQELQSDSAFFTTLLFYRSIDGGVSWTIQNPGLPTQSTINYAIPITNVQQIDSLNAVAFWSHYILRTFDGGMTWEKDSVQTTYNLSDVSFSDSMNGILATAGDTTIWITSDGGRTWKPGPLQGIYLWYCYTSAPGHYCVLKAGYGPFYRTDDNWVTIDSTMLYDSISDPGFSKGIFSIHGSAGDTILLSGTMAPTGSIKRYPLIIRTTDGGKLWNEVLDTQADLGGVYSMSSIDRDTIYAAIANGTNQLMMSSDRGATWHLVALVFDTNWTAEDDDAIEITPSGGFVGIFGYDRAALVSGHLQTTLSAVNPKMIGNDLQAFPNPLTTSATISFSAPSSGYAEVSIVNLLGVEVARLFAGEIGAGEHSFVWDAAKMAAPSGVYECLVRINGQVQRVGLIVE